MNKYLLDTHILLWSLFNPDKLNTEVKNIMKDYNFEKYVCNITFWEISLKYSIGKLELDNVKPDDINKLAIESGLLISEVSSEEYASSYKLPFVVNHKDPFNRIIIWYAINNKMTLISSDKKFSDYEQLGLSCLDN